jgi:hypothetical protein
MLGPEVNTISTLPVVAVFCLLLLVLLGVVFATLLVPFAVPVMGEMYVVVVVVVLEVVAAVLVVPGLIGAATSLNKRHLKEI